jgi:hypothetical protein
VLWRRTKLGLHLSDTQRAAVAAWCRNHWGELPGTAATGAKAETSWN